MLTGAIVVDTHTPTGRKCNIAGLIHDRATNILKSQRHRQIPCLPLIISQGVHWKTRLAKEVPPRI